LIVHAPNRVPTLSKIEGFPTESRRLNSIAKSAKIAKIAKIADGGMPKRGVIPDLFEILAILAILALLAMN